VPAKLLVLKNLAGNYNLSLSF